MAALAVAGCSSSSSSSGANGTLQVAAAENFWGSIAAQLGGSHAHVTSILTDPNADPHEYTSNPDNARLIAGARYVITNGAGYDAWADKLLAGNPATGRRVLTVAALLGKKGGDNPHFWYDPAAVARVADRITADYKQLQPASAAYFDAQRRALAAALAPYRARIAAIRARFAGTPVGSTETIFVYMANALGLNLISPTEFMKAVAESTEPPAQSVVQFQQQLNQRQAKVLVYNVQTSTPVTTNIRGQATAKGIPVVGVSESLQPPGTTFQAWQVAQLDTLQKALNTGAGVK